MNNFIKNTAFQIIVGLVLVILVTWGSIALLSHRGVNYSSSLVSRKDLTQTVVVNGKVTSDQSVTLAFNMQGRVAGVNVDVGSATYAGQVLASLDTGTLMASLTGAQADVLAAQARLTQITNGARPEEQALYIQKYNDATIALVSAMKSAYLSMIDAIVSKSDSLYTNGNTVNPTLNIHAQSDTEKRSIEQDRIVLRDQLERLKNTLSNLSQSVGSSISTSTLLIARTETHDMLSQVKSYLDQLGSITSNLNPGNSGQSQSVIDSERLVVTNAAQEVNNAMSAEQSVDAVWSVARDSMVLELAGSTMADIQIAEAALGKVQSVVQGLENQIKQSRIISPYDGIVTAMNVKIGEVYVPGMSTLGGISVIGNGSFKVEVYVPETDIGKIVSDNPVDITLDAYGPNINFTGHVTQVDPAATIQGGVSAYRVSILFNDQKDARIKSGLTANAVITTKTVADALVVPSRAIINRGASTIILVKDPVSGVYVEKTVKVGIVSAEGYTEISPVTAGDIEEGDTIAGFGLGQ